MRVVHIITGLATGGAERMLQDRLALTRHDVDVVALSVEGEIAERLRAAGTPVHGLGMRSNLDIGSVVGLARLLRRLRPDVVHVHLYRSLIYGRVAARLAGVSAIVATEHSALEDSTEGRQATRGVRSLYRAAERLGRLTVAVSSTTKDILVRRWNVPAERIVVIPNGIDTARLRISPELRARRRVELGIDDDVRLVVAAGRLVEGKRFGDLIDALTGLDPRVHLLVAGDGPQRKHLVDRVHAGGLTGRVHFAGVVDDILTVLAPGDVFASASVVETYGIAIVEAYVAGLPVVYVQCPAVNDLTGGAPCPRLVRAQGSPEGIARAISIGLEQAAGADLVGDAERERVDIRAVSRRLDDLEELVGARRRRPGRWVSTGASPASADEVEAARER